MSGPSLHAGLQDRARQIAPVSYSGLAGGAINRQTNEISAARCVLET